jgi:predicted anti-sigma-YlaC factor YlaD
MDWGGFMNNICAERDEKLAELLLDAENAPVEVLDHLEECESCRDVLDELRATMAVLDEWEAPEPNPYFLTRLEARLRDERAAEPLGWLSQLWVRLTGAGTPHLRPLAAMTLTFLLLVGGGAYLGVTDWDQPAAAPEQTAVVHDLETLDSNAQLLDQLEALSNNGQNGD